MKIIVATPLYPPEIDRIAGYSRQLARQLAKDNQVTVLAFGYKIIQEDNFHTVVVDKTKPLFFRLFNYTIKLLKLAKNHDVIYVQNAVASGLPAILVKYLTGKAVVVNFFEDEAFKRAVNWRLTDQSLENFLQHKILDKRIRRVVKIQSWVLKRASKVIVSSSYLAKILAKKYKLAEEKIVVNNICEDRDYQLPFDSKKINNQLFLWGPLLKWTGADEVLKAVAKVKENINDISLIISGEGSYRKELLELIKKLDLGSNVKLLGRVSQAENWYWLKTSSAYIHNFSGFDTNYHISQSFLAQTPVIVKDTEYNREILSDVQSGLIFSANSHDDLADKIKQILSNNNLSLDLIDKANKNLASNFSWHHHVNKLSNIFLSLVKK